VAVGDDQRRPRVGLGLAEGEHGLLRVGAEGDAGDVDVAVGSSPAGRGPSSPPLPAAANLATAPIGVAFDCLAAGVGVHLGVEHQDVDVAAAPARGRGRRSRCRRPSRRRRRSTPLLRTRCRRARPAPRAVGVVARRSSRAQRGDPRALRGGCRSRRRCGAVSRPLRPARRRAGAPPAPAAARVALVPSTAQADARGRTRRCPRTASWPTPGRALRRSVVYGVVGRLPP
jgi:hypothetical protein